MNKKHDCGVAPSQEPSGETMAQREEVCAAWADLPAELTAHPGLKRLYRALGGISPRGVLASPTDQPEDTK